ncbi:putative cytochrome P450 4p3 [Aphomia sociella]
MASNSQNEDSTLEVVDEYIYLGQSVKLVLTDAADAEFILKNCLSKGYIMNLLKLLLGDGILLSTVSKWRPRRKIFAQGFGQKLLNKYVRIFDERSNVMLDRLRAHAGKGPFALLNYVTSLKLDTVCQTILGINVGAQKDKDALIPKLFEACFSALISRITDPVLYPDIIFNNVYKSFESNKDYVINFLLQIIKSKREEINKQQNSHRGDLQDMVQDEYNDISVEKSLLESVLETKANELMDKDLQEEFLTIVAAGTDTSAVGSCFMAMLLARHPDTQEKIYEEIKEVLDDNRPVEAKDLPRFRYLEAVIQETLRYFPPVPFIFREIDKKLTLPSGITVLPGMEVMVHIRGIHRNPKYWDDPDVFKPERFINYELKHPAAFIPFSYGPRNCIGYKYAMMSMKTTLVNLVRKYRLLPANEKCVNDEFPLKYAIMQKHYDDFPIKVELRT